MERGMEEEIVDTARQAPADKTFRLSDTRPFTSTASLGSVSTLGGHYQSFPAFPQLLHLPILKVSKIQVPV
jgi:hypothetical protein